MSAVVVGDEDARASLWGLHECVLLSAFLQVDRQTRKGDTPRDGVWFAIGPNDRGAVWPNGR